MPNTDVTRIASNIGALFALNSLQNINKQLSTHQTRLATGKRINSAEDDPAGLSIASKLLARSEGLKVANDNIGDTKNMMAIAEGGLGAMNDILIKMRSKAQAAASDTLGVGERDAISSQLSAFSEQIDNIVNETKWNDVKLLTGNLNKLFQTGVDKGENTRWIMTANLTAGSAGFALSEKVSTATIDNKSAYGTSFDASTSGSLSATSTWLTAASIGSYQFVVLASSGSTGTDGYVGGITANTMSGVTSLSASTVGSSGELSKSGQWRMEISNIDTTTGSVYVRLTGAGNTVNGQLAQVSGGSTWRVTDSSGNAIGVELNLASGISGSNLLVGTSANFEYIKTGEVKISLKDSMGTSVAIDKDGTADTKATATEVYAKAGSVLHTGRGFSVSLAGIASIKKNDNISFDWKPQGDYVVDVSTVEKASDYLGSVSAALDQVNSQLASLGSLMARLDFKQQQVNTSQINVEASYSRIMNANMAEEQVNASKYMILQQTATAMLAQANAAPQFLLSLFQ